MQPRCNNNNVHVIMVSPHSPSMSADKAGANHPTASRDVTEGLRFTWRQCRVPTYRA